MKTTRKIGLLVLTGIGLGVLVSYWLPGLNFGLGGGPGEGGSATNSNSAATAPGIDAADSTNSSGTEGQAGLEDGDGTPPEVVYVLIDDRSYLLRRGPEGSAAYKPADLDSIVKAAGMATGDSNGIRIRISQKSTSRETTERALRAKLDEAGIPGDAIRWKDEPVE